MKKGILVLLTVGGAAHAGIPVWSFTPIGSPVISVSDTGTATASYTITNNSNKPHQLVLSANTPSGITQSGGGCVLAGLGSTCTLTLNIKGSALPSDNVSGGPILCQANTNGTPNPNQCYQPNPGDALVITRTTAPGATTLSASVSQLALSVTGLTEYGVTGTPSSGVARQITITNTGSNPASGLSVLATGLPTGTDITTTSTTCTGTLAAGSTCTITVTPGANATSDCNTSHSAPTPGVVTVSATNVATSVTTNVVVLGYSCQYQGGYVYAFNDTTSNTGSVGGKVATTSDQAAAYPNGVIWSSNGVGSVSANVSNDIIPLISEIVSSPTYADAQSTFNSTYANVATYPFPASSVFSSCNGATDGQCNSNNILALYDTYKTGYGVGSSPYTLATGPTNRTYYAAGLCKQTISGYSDWYLPAICEMGYGGAGCGTSVTPTLQNMQKSLIDISSLSAPAGSYWSSTETSGNPQFYAWYEGFASGGGSTETQFYSSKDAQLGVRCSRVLTL